MSEILQTKEYILIVDDEENILLSYEITLNSIGIDDIVLCSDSRKVIPILNEREIELVILDLTMPFISGEEILAKIKSEFPEIPVIIITGNLEIESAVRCMQAGALDYIIKPVDGDRLISSVKRTLERGNLLKENKLLKTQLLSTELERPGMFSSFNSCSRKMFSIFKYAEAVSSSPEPILLTGETGVGKELMARIIHQLSNRTGAFVPVSIAGLDENMFSDTLFGHKKGAFTDANQDRDGLVEKAKGGTLFLDEIGDLKPQSQIKLLRLIQEKEYYRLGDDKARHTNAHIVTATNRDLSRLMQTGQFRKDLFYRLDVHHINIPSLRKRPEDIPLLIYELLEEASKVYEKEKPTPPDELFVLLSNYTFPGNIRELRSMMFNAVSSHKKGILSLKTFRDSINSKAPGQIDKVNKEISDDISGFHFPHPLPSLKIVEIFLIKKAMKEADGNQSIAAGILGITRQTLNKKLKLTK